MRGDVQFSACGARVDIVFCLACVLHSLLGTVGNSRGFRVAGPIIDLSICEAAWKEQERQREAYEARQAAEAARERQRLRDEAGQEKGRGKTPEGR